MRHNTSWPTDADTDTAFRGRNAIDRNLVLVALEPRFYREVIAGAVVTLRPHLAVEVAETGASLVRSVERLAPELVLSSAPGPGTAAGDRRRRPTAWVKYSPYEEPKALVVNGQKRQMGRNVDLPDLLGVVDEVLPVQ